MNPITALLVSKTSAKRWEVRINDHRKTLLGVFFDEASRDLFVEAVSNLCRAGNMGFESVALKTLAAAA